MVGELRLVLLLTEIAPDFDLHSLDRFALLVRHLAAERLFTRQQLDLDLIRDLWVSGVVLREIMSLLDIAVTPDIDAQDIVERPVGPVDSSLAVLVSRRLLLLHINERAKFSAIDGSACVLGDHCDLHRLRTVLVFLRTRCRRGIRGLASELYRAEETRDDCHRRGKRQPSWPMQLATRTASCPIDPTEPAVESCWPRHRHSEHGIGTADQTRRHLDQRGRIDLRPTEDMHAHVVTCLFADRLDGPPDPPDERVRPVKDLHEFSNQVPAEIPASQVCEFVQEHSVDQTRVRRCNQRSRQDDRREEPADSDWNRDPIRPEQGHPARGFTSRRPRKRVERIKPTDRLRNMLTTNANPPHGNQCEGKSPQKQCRDREVHADRECDGLDRSYSCAAGMGG